MAPIWPLLVVTALTAEPRPAAVSRPNNVRELANRLGLATYQRELPVLSHMRVAVLDSGFDAALSRPYLPSDTVLVEDYDPDFVRRNDLGDPAFRKALLPGNSHGRAMAQIAWAATGGKDHGPKWFLLNANGPTMFRRAVRYAVEQRVQVIVFCGHFEGVGNYDGRGPINAVVDEAVRAGILWVNAAGNLRGQVYDGPVEIGPDGWLKFGELSALRFRNRVDENTVTMTLTWNDYRDAEDAGTAKDLDLIVEDAAWRELAASRLRQVTTPPANDGESRNPRERVVVSDLAASELPYRIRVRAAGGTFGPKDRLRILVTPSRNQPIAGAEPGAFEPAFAFLDPTPERQVYPPADHAGVITVGDPRSSVGPTADGRNKPDIVLHDSRVTFSNGDETSGSSNAAALFAGAVILMKAAEPQLTAEHVLQWAKRKRAVAVAARFRPDASAPVPLSPNWVTPTPRELAVLARGGRK